MDLIILFNTFFGFLTFIAWVSTAAMLYLYFSKKTFSKLITDQFLNFAISVAVFSSIGSIVYSEVVGFISIPVMAGTGFLTIFVALLYYDFARKELVE